MEGICVIGQVGFEGEILIIFFEGRNQKGQTSSVSSPKREIWVIGGETESDHLDGASKIVEIYDLESNSWSSGPSLSIERCGSGAALVDDKIFCLGGYSGTEMLNSMECISVFESSAQWEKASSLNNERYWAAVVKKENQIFAFGGSDLDSSEIYDINTGIWTYGPSMTRKKDEMAAVLVGETVYLLGGHAGSDDNFDFWLETTECLNFETSRWNELPPMARKKGLGIASVVGDKIYVFGGWSEKGGTSNAVECFDIKTNTWQDLSPMALKRCGGASVVVDDIVYIFGGFNGEYIGVVESFDTKSKAWTTLASMPTPRLGVACVLVTKLK